jgi:hypothetical protein
MKSVIKLVLNKTTMLLETQGCTLLGLGPLWDGSKVEPKLCKEDRGDEVDDIWTNTTSLSMYWVLSISRC